MITYFPSVGTAETHPKGGPHRGSALVVDGDNENVLHLMEDGILRESFDLGPHRLFRPDHDAMFISKEGVVWRPS